ncbi:MAG: AAA family ATPase [Clostridia bacterium]|nr:AAA family ATPase [Clostridia bacterium]
MRRGALFIREAAIDWDAVPRGSYLRDIPALKGFRRLAFDANVTFFAGENGTGKSTLLEGIAVAYGYNPEGGTKNYHFSTYRDVSELEEAIRLVRGYRQRNSGYFFRAESFFNVATAAKLEYNDDGSMPDYHAQSHGESFLSFLQDECREGVYLMDEPEAALSPQRQLTLMLHIHSMALEGSQFIIATHSPILLGLPEARILDFSEDGIHPIRYEETGSYQITKLFLKRREQILGELFKDTGE